MANGLRRGIQQTLPFQLCYITDRRGLAPQPLLPRILEAARAGVELVQIREKDLETRALVELVKAALEGARGSKTRILVNDRLDVVLGLGAHGVHLATNSLPAGAARASVPADLLPGFIVGVSCHSLEEALAAEAARADYVVFGPVFETLSKAQYGPPLGLGRLNEVTARVKIPVLALGGVTVERVQACRDAGAAGVAGIRIFQDCPSIAALVRDLRAQLNL